MSNRDRGRRGARLTQEEFVEEMRVLIAANLGVPAERIRFGDLGCSGRMGTSDPHWQVRYQGKWRELPWHFDGPLCVTWAMIRAWHG